MKIAPFIVSRQTGIGKSLLIERVGSLLGEYFKPVDSKEIKGTFNPYLYKSLLVYIDEAMLADKIDVAELLKQLVTKEWVRVNEKFQPVFDVKTYANYAITSNRLDGIYIEDKDRRYFAIRACEERLSDEFYTNLCNWWDAEGKHHVMHYLKAYPLKGFNPHAAAPETEFKRILIADGRTDAQRFVAELAAEDDSRPLRQIEDLTNAFCGAGVRESDWRKAKWLLRKALHDAGAVERRVRMTRTPERKVWLWPVRDYKALSMKTDKEWADQFRNQPDGQEWLHAVEAKEVMEAVQRRQKRPLGERH
jgi:Family of unknown function (DUF5906)